MVVLVKLQRGKPRKLNHAGEDDHVIGIIQTDWHYDCLMPWLLYQYTMLPKKNKAYVAGQRVQQAVLINIEYESILFL